MKLFKNQNGIQKNMPIIIKIILAIVCGAAFIGLLILQAKTGTVGFSCH